MPSRAETIFSVISPALQPVVKPLTSKVSIAENAPRRSINLVGHGVLTFLYFGGIIAYTVWVLTAFFTRPEVESFSILPARDFPSVSLTISTVCSNQPFCGNITIAQNYTVVAGQDGGTSQCFRDLLSQAGTSPLTRQQILVAGTPQVDPVVVSLCPVADDVFSVETTAYLPLPAVQVDFLAINPGQNKTTGIDDVRLKSTAAVRIDAAAAGLRRIVNMDTWQVKTLVLETYVQRVDGVIVNQRLLPSTVQYEGKRPNWRATLLIRMDPLATVSDRTRPGTVVDALASIGGAVTVITALMVLLVPLFSVVFPGEAMAVVASGEQSTQQPAANAANSASPMTSQSTKA